MSTNSPPRIPITQSVEVATTLKEYLTQENKVVIEIPGDGNCLFHAISEAFERKTVGMDKSRRLTGKKIRKSIIANIEQNANARDFFQTFLTGETFVAYCKRMKKSGEYGDQIALIAIACTFDLKITVLVDNDPLESYDHVCFETEDGEKFPIVLKYTPFESNNVNGSGHYDLILDRKLVSYKFARENALANHLLEFPFNNKMYKRSSNKTVTFLGKEPAKPTWIF
jgi:hypothetical protein